MRDRPFVAFQYDTIPNKFWGRGICEKGYNAQKALDAELRARIDAMALAAHPMLGVNALQLPRGAKLTAGPGKVWLSNGDPGQTFQPMQFSGASPASFSQSGELERMVSVATGTFDSAAPTGVSPRNNTASGMSMIQGSMIKRGKRTMQNITRDFLEPLLQKTLWRYMEFDPTRYPAGNYEFQAIAGVGIMAREFESAQMVNLMSIVPQGSPLQLMLAAGVIENTSLDNKEQLAEAINAMMQPDPEAQQMQQAIQQLEMAERQKKLEKLDSEVFENYAQGQSKLAGVDLSLADAETNRIRAINETQKVRLEGLLKQDL
jgi:hypothetical protein